MNTENNNIIAEFMEIKVFNNLVFFKVNGENAIGEMQYDTDWNWIMEVVEKIDGLGYEVVIGRISCQVNNMLERENPISNIVCGDVSQKLEITYRAIVHFIKWYNQNGKK